LIRNLVENDEMSVVKSFDLLFFCHSVLDTESGFLNNKRGFLKQHNAKTTNKTNPF